MAQGSEGSKAIALGLCREFEDKFLEHIAGGEVSEYNVHPLGLHLLNLFMILSFFLSKVKVLETSKISLLLQYFCHHKPASMNRPIFATITS